MDYLQMTAPCGLPCFNCHFYLAGQGNAEAQARLDVVQRITGLPREAMLCQGCRAQDGCIQLHAAVSDRGPEEPCVPLACTREKGIDFCYECDDFPCDQLHPYSDRADKVPHNTKVFNLCLIQRMGLEEWAREKAAQVQETYFTQWWSL